MYYMAGRSPFYPGQPVPIEFFIGRTDEIERIVRSLKQVELGKPQAIFLTGEYGIGKSSLAGYIRSYAEKENHLLGIHVLLGGAQTLENMAVKTVETVIKEHNYNQSIGEKIRNFLSKYIGKQELWGININLEALKSDSPNISNGFLPFLRDLLKQVEGNGIKGIMLILDELNGITSNPNFAHFIKTLVDENALDKKPLPLMLILCGVDERRGDMIKHHQPIERIFDIIEIKPMNKDEMEDFFHKTFSSESIQVTDEAISLLCHCSAGFPKIMHLIGDAIFWIDQDKIVDREDSLKGLTIAIEDIGKKFVDQQVYKALRSKDYHSILTKLGKVQFDSFSKVQSDSFSKEVIEKTLNDKEKKKFNNFLHRMKRLNVLRSGDERGEYIFNHRLVQLYIALNSIYKK